MSGLDGSELIGVIEATFYSPDFPDQLLIVKLSTSRSRRVGKDLPTLPVREVSLVRPHQSTDNDSAIQLKILWNYKLVLLPDYNFSQ